jgi:kexin
VDDGNEWETTFAGRKFSYKFGYGKLDVEKLVNNARNVKQVPPQVAHDSGDLLNGESPLRIPHGDEGVNMTYTFKEVHARISRLGLLEHVTVTLSIDHDRRGDIEVDLISPNGISSVLATSRPGDRSRQGLQGWRFMSVKHWYFLDSIKVSLL